MSLSQRSFYAIDEMEEVIETNNFVYTTTRELGPMRDLSSGKRKPTQMEREYHTHGKSGNHWAAGWHVGRGVNWAEPPRPSTAQHEKTRAMGQHNPLTRLAKHGTTQRMGRVGPWNPRLCHDTTRSGCLCRASAWYIIYIKSMTFTY